MLALLIYNIQELLTFTESDKLSNTLNRHLNANNDKSLVSTYAHVKTHVQEFVFSS